MTPDLKTCDWLVHLVMTLEPNTRRMQLVGSFGCDLSTLGILPRVFVPCFNTVFEEMLMQTQF